jgi:hypothetical protein
VNLLSNISYNNDIRGRFWYYYGNEWFDPFDKLRAGKLTTRGLAAQPGG